MLHDGPRDLDVAAVSIAMAALSAAADRSLHELTDGEVLDRCRELVQVANRVSSELTRTVRHAVVTGAAARDGLASMASWLRTHARYSGSAAAAVVRAGRALEHVPVLAAAFAAGEVTTAQVGVVADALGPTDVARAAEQGVDLEPFDRVWTEVATTLPHAKLATAVTAFAHALDPDGTEPDPTGGRRLNLTTHGDGSVTGRFDLDAVGGEKVKAALESVVQASRPKGDLRTRAQQNADALVQLCDNQLASGHLPLLRTVKPHIVATIDLQDLLDPATGHDSATTGFGALISAARTRWLACDASITRIVLGPDGLPLDVGRTARVVPPHIRRAVEHRDGHCVFTGCDAPTHWADVHHLEHWIHGGDTSLENSALLCERHHTQVHHGFQVTRDDSAPPGHRWRTWRPDGTEIVLGPVLG